MSKIADKSKRKSKCSTSSASPSGQNQKRSSASVPEELKKEQTKRLTSRHLDALMELQDTKQENEQLKNKIDLLEKELLSSQRLDHLERNAEIYAKDTEEQFAEKLKDIVTELTDKQNKKVKELTDKYITEINLISDESNTLKKQWKKEEDMLNEKINNLEGLNEEQKKSFESFEQKMNNIEVLHEKLDDALKTLTKVKQENTSLMKSKEQSEKEGLSLKLEKDELLDQVKIQNEDINRLKNDLYKETELRRRLVDQNDFIKEIDKVTSEVNDVKKQKEVSENLINDLHKTNEELTKSLNTYEEKFALLELENEVVKQSADDLLNEVDFLKGQLSNIRVSSSTSFSNVVDLKREVKSLKEKNSKLKHLSTKSHPVSVLKSDGSCAKHELKGKVQGLKGDPKR